MLVLRAIVASSCPPFGLKFLDVPLESRHVPLKSDRERREIRHPLLKLSHLLKRHDRRIGDRGELLRGEGEPHRVHGYSHSPSTTKTRIERFEFAISGRIVMSSARLVPLFSATVAWNETPLYEPGPKAPAAPPETPTVEAGRISACPTWAVVAAAPLNSAH